MFNGAYLIFFASFVLTGLALVTGVTEGVSGTKSLSDQESEQIAEFMQFIIFGGFVITLLFGSVGANIFSAGLLNNDNLTILRRLDEIEAKIDDLHQLSTDNELPMSKIFLLIKLGAVLGAIACLYWAKTSL